MKHIPRAIESLLLQALRQSPIVFLNGPRQAGKSTLVRALPKREFPAEYVTFDSATQMAAATHSPKQFLTEQHSPLIIDEAQLVPDIFRALKTVVDERRLASDHKLVGQFLLTGSANVMALPKLADALVGRVSVLTLYPLAGAEISGGRGDFIERLFAGDFEAQPPHHRPSEAIRAATFPELAHSGPSERYAWLDGYLTTILQRDVRTLAEISKLHTLPHLLRILAHRVGGLVNDAQIARDAGYNPMTCRNYKALLTSLFLTFEIKPWYRNVGKRLVKASKGYLVDTLLATHLLGHDLDALERSQPEVFGRLLENFVATELLKLMSLHASGMELLHFRTSDNKEVDFVIEKPNGQLAALEVKHRESVGRRDFKGLEALQQLARDDFACGVVLYGGDEVVPFGPKLWAVPIAQLWA